MPMWGDRTMDHPQDFIAVQRRSSETEICSMPMWSDRCIDHPQAFNSLPRMSSKPKFSHVSLRSDISIGHPPDLSLIQRKSSQPEISCVSMRSDISIGHPPDLSLIQRKSSQPEISCVSMRSDRSMGYQEGFSSLLQMRSKPTFSHVSMRIDIPMGHPPDLSLIQRKSSQPEISCVSMRSDRSMGYQEGFSTLPRMSSKPKFSDVSVRSNISMGHPPDLNAIQRRISETEICSMPMWSDRCIDHPQAFNTLPRMSSKPKLSHMRINVPMGHPPDLSLIQRKSSQPEISCVSMRSDRTMGYQEGFSTLPRMSSKPKFSDVSVRSTISMGHPPDLSAIQRRISETEICSMPMWSDRCIDHPQAFNTLPRMSSKPKYSSFPLKSSVHDFFEVSLLERPLKIRHKAFNVFRSNLRKCFECLYEGTAKQGNPTLLNEVYTELYITESESGDINNEHEVRQIETQSRRVATEDKRIKCSDIFKPLPGQNKSIRTVLTKGVAGIGKTVSVQKFIIDWTEGKANQDVQLIFPLPFRELNLMNNKILSLSELLHVFFPVTQEMEIFSEQYKVLFIFDGLDECRISLDFRRVVRLCDVGESASVAVLLMNLLVGNLLPSALIWITSRPAAADLIPSECVHRVTEIRGFNEPQKAEYFKKRISNQSLANRIISHLKSSRSLYIMCHIPVFCWISAAVLEKMLSTRAASGEIPKTLTQMYTHFLVAQISIKGTKYKEKKGKDKEMIFKLGKLAYEQLKKGNLIFYEEDLRECGIDVTEASVYSGMCTQIFREELGLNQGRVFCFVHLSIQEHLAALYVHLSFTNHSKNVFKQITKQSLWSKVRDWVLPNSSEHVSVSGLHKRAVDESLESKNGHLDLFLRFLLGLSVESNQILLQELMTLRRSSSDSNKKTIEYIKMKIRIIDSPEKSINLFHCLNELDDHSLVEEIQQYLTSERIGEAKLSSSQWSAVVFVLLTSEKRLDKFDIHKFVGRKNKILQVLQKLLPVIKESRSVQLTNCGLTAEGCVALASALRSNLSHTKELNLSHNKLQDVGVKILCAGLEDPHCKLEKLWLLDCDVTAEGCAALASALRLNPLNLRQLDLSWNKLGQSDINLLFVLKDDPHYKLETLYY
ncbi:NLR family CARD domain-containing protein 3-like [Garra rufa]|uniref:NLR family CARD domain-containing protein 3-like n=1 Tax=Garra rufa TaxID=137080 RepID=UPI003CCED9B4